LSSSRSHNRSFFRLLAAILGVGLLAYLVFRIGPEMLFKQTLAVGWGMVLILFLAGLSHLIKSWAWQLTIPREFRRISLPRAFGLRLVSEAVGQFGAAGMVLGEGMRVSLLGSSVPPAVGISSASIDRGLYLVSAALAGIAGLIGAVILFPLSSMWRIYTSLFAGGLLAFLVVTVVAVRRQWPVLSVALKGLRRIPALRNRLNGTEQTLYSAEQKLLNFHREAPEAFWMSFVLNVASQVLAISEVYLLLAFMSSRIGFGSAFVFEGFNKLVSVVGGIVPGNVGTYEGGSMLIGRLFGVSSAAGLAVGVCRRVRGLFWAGVGALCLVAMSRSVQKKSSEPNIPVSSPLNPEEPPLQETAI